MKELNNFTSSWRPPGLILALATVVFALTSCSSVSGSVLYPFGTEVGDDVLERSDDFISPEVVLAEPVVLFGVPETSFYVSTIKFTTCTHMEFWL